MATRSLKIILFGGSGFVGRHLIRRLSEDGHRATVVTRYAPAVRGLTLIPGTRLVQADPHDPDLVAEIMAGHDVVINLVGILNERGFGGQGFRKAHVELVEKLIAGCRVNGIRRFVQMSALNAGQGESHYLRTRGEAETLVRKAAESGQLDATIFRPSTIFGPDDSFLNRFSTLLKISPIFPLARPRSRMAPVFVDDVTEAYATAVTNPETTVGQTYELCGPQRYELKEILIWLKNQLGLRRLVLGLPDWAGRLQGRIFDFVPGKPFSTDNFLSLKSDSVCQENGFSALGIAPVSMETIAPTWLSGNHRQYRYQQFRAKARPGNRGLDQV